jgi:DNA modification methylase
MTSGSHTATFPTKLVEIPIDACSEEGDVIFDPFSGYGTVALVSRMMRRRFIAFEINENYAKESNYRISRASTL